MSQVEIAILILVFLSVFAFVFMGMALLSPNASRQRLRAFMPGSEHAASPASTPWADRAVRVAERFSKLSLPDEGWEQSGIRRRFMNAGIRSAAAPSLFFGGKTILAVVLPLITYIALTLGGGAFSFNGTMMLLLVAAAFGYYLPNLILARLVFVRKREIFETFPDALDLMTVCVEAGLGVEAAINRVAEEIEHKSTVLSDELRMVGLELRAGSDRERALRNLAMRTGVEEVDSWVAMIVQADRFGTSIAAALRVHSEMLRTKRRQRAEEAAAKIALKLLFPLIFCIFPSLLLVLLGPAFIQIYRVLLPTMTGAGH